MAVHAGKKKKPRNMNIMHSPFTLHLACGCCFFLHGSLLAYCAKDAPFYFRRFCRVERVKYG